MGSASVENELGYTYTDEGATAVDNKDGTITSEITTVNSVDVDNEGIYTVTYDVTDAAGNVATQVVRTVTVTPDATLPVDFALWRFFGDCRGCDKLHRRWSLCYR